MGPTSPPRRSSQEIEAHPQFAGQCAVALVHSGTNAVVTLCSAIPGGRASPTAFATVASTWRVVSSAPGQKDPSSPEGCRASPQPTGFATVVPAAVALFFTSSRGTFPTVALVHAGPESPARLSLPETDVRLHPGTTIRVRGDAFHPVRLARNAKVSSCVALWRCFQDGRSNTMASSNSHRTYMAPSLQNWEKLEPSLSSLSLSLSLFLLSSLSFLLDAE